MVMMVMKMVRRIEETVVTEVLCVVVVVRDARDVMMFGGVRVVTVSEDEMCDDELDDYKSWEKEEGRLLVSLYSEAGRPWPYEKNGKEYKRE